jgi:hypothetical protein
MSIIAINPRIMINIGVLKKLKKLSAQMGQGYNQEVK